MTKEKVPGKKRDRVYYATLKDKTKQQILGYTQPTDVKKNKETAQEIVDKANDDKT